MRPIFTPLRFQASLAAGGLALMPFVLMQLTFPRAGTLITAQDLGSGGLKAPTLFLLGVMILATLAHFTLTFSSARRLVRWLADGSSARELVADPRSNSAIFSPVISLGMTVNVLLGPVAFFLPSASSALPPLVATCFYFYAALWLTLATLSAVVGRSWLSRPPTPADRNFSWLLDVFAWGMLALAGSGIAGLSADATLSRLATAMTVASIVLGLLVYAVKGWLLLRVQARDRRLPSDPLKPAFFVVVPINCLFAIAAFKISRPLDSLLGVHASAAALPAVLGLFSIAVLWTLACVIALRSWFVRTFPQPEFYPSQWGLVCVLVGLEVLGLYTYANYLRSPFFVGFAYVSTGVGAALYMFMLAKFSGAYSRRPEASGLTRSG